MSDARSIGEQPAFPGIIGETGQRCAIRTHDGQSWINLAPGVPTRLWLAAHAPSECQEWFTHTAASNRPIRNPSWEFCEGCKNDGHCIGGKDCDKIYDFFEMDQAWREANKKARFIQWPLAWADAILAESQKPKS